MRQVARRLSDLDEGQQGGPAGVNDTGILTRPTRWRPYLSAAESPPTKDARSEGFQSATTDVSGL